MHTSRSSLIRRAGFGVLALVLTAGPTAIANADELPVGSDQDITAPTLTAVTVDPTEVDVTDGAGKTITITASATDDLSGVARIDVFYRSPSGSWSIGASLGAGQRTSGTALAGEYSRTVQVDPLYPDGEWSLSQLAIYDVVGNYRHYTASSGLAPSKVTIHSAADDVPPDLSSISVDPGTLDVSSGIQAADVSAEFTEVGSGLSSVFGVFRSPSGRQSAAFSLRQQGTSSVAVGSTFVTQYAEPGTWALRTLCATDRAGNQSCYDATSSPTLTEKFGAVALEVISDPEDLQPPTASAYRLSQDQLDVTDGPAEVTTSFDVADDLSGVFMAYIRFESPRTAGASPEVINRYGFAHAPSIYSYAYDNSTGATTVTEDDSKRLMSGTLNASTTFPRYDRSGDWKVAQVCVVDNVNRQRCYTPTSSPSLGDIGPTGLGVEWNRTPVVAVTGITESTYLVGEEPTPGCTVTDLEDGSRSVQPVVTGPDTDGVVTVTCSYTDTGGVTGSAQTSYQVVEPTDEPPTVLVTGVTETTYYEDSEPTAGCSVTDPEDGSQPVEPIVTGPDAEGNVTVECSYTDTGGTTRSDSRTYQVVPVPNTPPSVSVTGVGSPSYEYGSEPVPGCSVTDAEDADPSATPDVTRPEGKLGVVVVECAYTDGGGLSDSDSVSYAVVDTTAPELTVSDKTAHATSASGATVTFAPSATDAVDDEPSVTCAPASGSTFAIGTTTVSCSAEDDSGNVATKTFTVTVLPSCEPGAFQGSLNADGSSVFKLGSAVLVRFAMTVCHGTSASAVTPTVSLRHLDRHPDGTVNEVVSTYGAADPGTTMRYDGSGSHSYILSTKKSQFCTSGGTTPCSNGDLVTGTYELTISAPELATPLKVRFSLRK